MSQPVHHAVRPLQQGAEKHYGEAEARVDLAACYRLMAHFGMSDLIYAHATCRVPGSGDHILINPYGMLFDEITASDLIKIDLRGRIARKGPWPVNAAGFVVHAALHAARPDVACIIHSHTVAGVAVSAQKSGLLPLSQFAMEFYNRVAYHEYEGLATDLDESRRLVRDLGQHSAMILRNHGLLTVGSSVAAAFERMYYLELACRTQVAAQQSGTALHLPPADVCEHAAAQYATPGTMPKGERVWQALLRMLDRTDPSYRN
jgi:ribulose-5-phosphate 4-epimerase/fuculose-1-phosphate aldolase